MIVIILASRIGGHLFEVARQPPVLGELVVGVVLGNLSILGLPRARFPEDRPGASRFLSYSTTSSGQAGDLDRAPGSDRDHHAALPGRARGEPGRLPPGRPVGVPRGGPGGGRADDPRLGRGAVLLPRSPWPVHMFLGASLSATSVGITARVLRDLGKSSTKEAQIVLGAAVIDDVLGLLVLSVVQAIILSLAVAGGAHGRVPRDLQPPLIFAKACGFLFGRTCPRPVREPVGLQGRQLPPGQRDAHGLGPGDLFQLLVARLADGPGPDRRGLRRGADPREGAVSRARRARRAARARGADPSPRPISWCRSSS